MRRRSFFSQLLPLEDRILPAVIVAPVFTALPPTANDDFVDTDGNNPVTVDLLENDAAVAPQSLNHASVQIVSAAKFGTVTIDKATGEATYTSTGFFQGTDIFTYTVKDSAGRTSNAATVTVVVNRPTANDDFAETALITPVVIDVLENDTDPDGNDKIDPASVTITTSPTHGTLSVAADGAVTYTPAAGFLGTDSFKYTIADEAGASSQPGTVTIVVNETLPSTTPIARDDIADTDGTNPVEVDVLANDSAGTGATINAGSIVLITQPQHGFLTYDKVVGSGTPVNGVFTYHSAGSYRGTDSYSYLFRDSNGTASNVATVTIVVNRPTANDDFADTDGNNPVTINVLENDTDPDGNAEIDPTTVKIISAAKHGTTSVDAATGEVTYTATGFFTGTDTFTYTITDLAGAESAPGTVTVVVNRPTANDDAAATRGLDPVAIDVLANDTDPDGNGELNPDSVAIIGEAEHGTLAIEAKTGIITYTPNSKFVGTDAFTYTVTDFPGAESNVATVHLRVDSPAATQITATGADAGGGPRITVTNADGSVKGSFFAFDPKFTGGVRVATGDVTGDGVPDVVAAAGAGGGPHVKVFDGATLALVDSFFAYDPKFVGGVSLAVADVNGDGRADIVTGAGPGGGPHVKVFNGVRHGGATVFAPEVLDVIQSTFAYAASFRGGVNVAVGDVNGDGLADVITTPATGATHVKVFDGRSFNVLRSFFAFDPKYLGGANVAAGDFNGDGFADIAVGSGPNNGGTVSLFNGKDGALLRSFLAYEDTFQGSVRVAAADLNADGRPELIAGPGPGIARPVNVYSGVDFSLLHGDLAFGGFRGGVFVGGPG